MNRQAIWRTRGGRIWIFRADKRCFAATWYLLAAVS